VPLHVLESRPVSGKDVPHWLSRLIDHIETRPRWFAAAKLTTAFALATVKFSPWMSFWPIITVAPSPCQICGERRWMPYCGYRLASWAWVACSAASADFAIVDPARRRAEVHRHDVDAGQRNVVPQHRLNHRQGVVLQPVRFDREGEPHLELGIGLLQAGDRLGSPILGGGVVQRGPLDVQVDVVSE
jgi:hypothetical protein